MLENFNFGLLYALAFGAISVLATLRYPPIGVCIHLLAYDFVSTNETFGFLNWGSNIIPLVLAVIVCAASIYRLLLWYLSGRASLWLLIAACASIVCGVYPLLALAATGSFGRGFSEYLTYIMESGPVLILPVLAYGMEKPARYLFGATVIFQMILAFLILNFPVGIFAELNAANYRSYAALSSGVDSAGNIMRAVGQFSTPIQLGAYATACFGIGIVLFKKTQGLLKLVASGIILLGLWGEYISFTRGLLFAAVFALILFRFPRRGWKALAAALAITLVTFWAGQNLLQMTQNDTTGAIAKHMEEVTNPEDDPIHYRVSGLMNSVSIVRSDPAFGTCSVQAILDRGEICHFFPGWLAAIYGLPAGLAALLLLFCAIKNQFKDENRFYLRDVSSDKFLCSLFGWSALFVLSSNFMGGRALVWIMLGFACLIASWPAAKPASTMQETR